MGKEFILTLDMPFGNDFLEKGIIFSKFLPKRNLEAIKINKNNFEILIYFSYDKKDLQHLCKDFIKSQKEVKKQFNIFVNNLKFELKKSISDELYSNLGNNIKNVETENF